MRCITANVLQTNQVDAQYDKLVTKLYKLTTLRIESCQFSANAPAFNLFHLYLVPPLGVTPLEFCRDFWHQKTRVLGLSCGIVRVSLRLAILVEHRLVTDRQTDRQTHDDSQYLR